MLARQLLPVTRRAPHLHAARASRRTRTGRPPTAAHGAPAPALPPWRLRVSTSRRRTLVFDCRHAVRTPALAWHDGSLRQVSGPEVDAGVLAHVVRQVTAAGLDAARWGLAPARVGPSCDLVACGSALRLHAVTDGALVRVSETLTFQHAADGARTLGAAAAAYERLAGAADRMAAAGGRLAAADDGFLHVRYDAR